MAERYRAVIDEGAEDTVFDLVGTVDGWLRAAFDHGRPDDRAEALYYRTIAVAQRAKGPLILAERERLLIGNEGIPTEAGYWLGVVGRLRDAVLAVETSRAILLGRLTGWLDADLRTELHATGNTALLDDYISVLSELGDRYRGQYSGASTPRPADVVVGGQAFRTGHLTELHQASARVDFLHRRIEDVTGSPVRSLKPITYPLVEQSAAVAPLVYLGAAIASGYALLVTETGEPRMILLPELTSGAVTERVAVVQNRFTDPSRRLKRLDWRAAVAETVHWLGEVALQPLTELLRECPDLRGKPIGLIAIGATGALPVAAALLTVGGPPVWHLPYARALTGSAEQSFSRPANVRVCAVPKSQPRELKLPRAGREIDWFLSRYAGRVRADPEATIAHVVEALHTTDVVQLICHGKAVLKDALCSALQLSDGDLTVRVLLVEARCTARLVVLSACESQAFDPRMTDEIIGLPLALHQAGVASVVAGQWKVDDIPTALLIRRLHDELLRGVPIAQALAEAQNWLREASRRELHDTYPDAYYLLGGDETVRPFAHPADWAAFTCSGYLETNGEETDDA
ncbi:CHAT domain-containing protein [Frankia tisae]|uniref:CHAT domain-containing protein n=1 Tax=Frankia tisae TaxID=2950104 RepID=UPI0021BE0D4C|nr:CHAT domain-containing protein [Frankia tisae]